MKKMVGFVLAVMVILYIVPVVCADNSVPLADLIISDVSLSNPYYKPGDTVNIKVTVKNIGKMATKGEWIGITLSVERIRDTNIGVSNILQPGDTKTIEYKDYQIKSKTIRYSCSVDTSNNIVESDKTNNITTGVLRSIKPGVDLIVSDVKMNEENTKIGEKATFKITIGNVGILDMPYSKLKIDLDFGGHKQTIEDVYTLPSNAEIVINMQPMLLTNKTMLLTVTVNAQRVVAESIYDNNMFTKRIVVLDSADYQWDTVRLGGGGFVTGGVIHPTEANLMYIRTDVGGAYRFNNDEQKWEPITDWIGMNEQNLYGVQGIAVDPSDPEIVYLCAGLNSGRKLAAWKTPKETCDVLKSTDRGKTFIRTNLNIDFEANGEKRWLGEPIAVDPNNSDVLYVGGPYDGLWRCTNAKSAMMKWEKVPLSDYIPSTDVGHPLGIRSVVFDKSSLKNGVSQIIYIGILNVGVYRTMDSGRNWELIPNSPATPARMDIKNDGTLYVSTEKEGVMMFKEGAWSDISPENGLSYDGLSINSLNNEQIVVSQYKAGFKMKIFYSDNSGKTWRNIKDNAVGKSDVSWWGNEKFGAAIAWILFDWNKPGKVWFGDWYGIWTTDDITAERTNWTTHQEGHEEMVAFDMATPKNGARLLTTMADNDGTRHTNINEFPVLQFNKPSMSDGNGIDVCESDPNIVARVGGYSWGQSGDGGYSLDNGVTWKQFLEYPKASDGIKKPNGRISIASTKNDNGIPTMMVVPINSKPYRSDNFGKSWTEIKTLPDNGVSTYWSSNVPMTSDLMDGNIFYFYGKDGWFYVSTDNARTFQKAAALPKGVAMHFVRSAPSMKGEVWVSLDTAGLYRSNDAGISFTKVENVQRSYLMGFGKEAPGTSVPTAYVYGRVNNTDGVFRSTDLGKTWVKITNSLEGLGCQPKGLMGDRQTFGIVYIGSGGRGFYCGMPAELDIKAPKIFIDGQDGAQRENTYMLTGHTSESTNVSYKVNDGESKTVKTDVPNRFTVVVNLTQGMNKITVSAIDQAGNMAEEKVLNITYDPNLVLLKLDQADCVDLGDIFTISGSVNVLGTEKTVDINGIKVKVNEKNRRFETRIPLVEGINQFVVTAADEIGNTVSTMLTVNRDVFAPMINFNIEDSTTEDTVILVEGSVNEAASVTIASIKVYTNEASNYQFKVPVALKPGMNVITAVAEDTAKNKTEKTLNVNCISNIVGSDVISVGKANQIKVDGILDESQWILNGVANKQAMGNSDNIAKFGLLGDANNLYIALKVYDNHVYSDISPVSYNNDCIEIYIDAEHTKTSKYTAGDNQITIKLNGDITSVQGMLNGAVSKAVLTKDGYDMEVAIPWTSLKLIPVAGKTFGFDISINDNDVGAGRDGVVTWNGDSRNWESAENFGSAVMFMQNETWR